MRAKTMRRLVLWTAILLPAVAGCTFSRSGSQGLSFNPFKLGSDEPALSAADDYAHVDGERWNQR